MIKNIFVALLFSSLINTGFSQASLVIQPGAGAGKDALLHGLDYLTDANFYDTKEFVANAWTFNGVFGIVRSVVEFDLTVIPPGAAIEGAYLSLYAWDSPTSMEPHSNLSGSNACWLQRITTYWEEETVTWNNQPDVTTQNQVGIPETGDPDKDYLDIDVTALVRDMLLYPESSFGFMLKLQDENYYRRMNFCSSDHPDSLKHPKLVITFKTDVFPDSCFTIER